MNLILLNLKYYLNEKLYLPYPAKKVSGWYWPAISVLYWFIYSSKLTLTIYPNNTVSTVCKNCCDTFYFLANLFFDCFILNVTDWSSFLVKYKKVSQPYGINLERNRIYLLTRIYKWAQTGQHFVKSFGVIMKTSILVRMIFLANFHKTVPSSPACDFWRTTLTRVYEFTLSRMITDYSFEIKSINFWVYPSINRSIAAHGKLIFSFNTPQVQVYR